MPAVFSVTPEETMNFAEVWKDGGIFVPMSPSAIKFATDYANITLASFIQLCGEEARAAREKQQTIEGKNLIVEGV